MMWCGSTRTEQGKEAASAADIEFALHDEEFKAVDEAYNKAVSDTWMAEQELCEAEEAGALPAAVQAEQAHEDTLAAERAAEGQWHTAWVAAFQQATIHEPAAESTAAAVPAAGEPE